MRRDRVRSACCVCAPKSGTQSARRRFGEWALLCAVIEVMGVLYLRAAIGYENGERSTS